MAKRIASGKALAELDRRLKIVLPEEYKETYEKVLPTPMRSAGLKFAPDGSVAWDEIWGSFCDLAMAGGPPHKGALLEPAPPDDINAHRARYDDVVAEICRGVGLVTDLLAMPASSPGWIRVDCLSVEMAAWLLRAISMENVAVRGEARTIELPASPAFRLEKEIKNVVTVIAKTCHYWTGHMPREQKAAIAKLFDSLDASVPLLRPSRSIDGARTGAERSLTATLGDRIFRELGFRTSHHEYSGWIGVECPSVHAAVWMMRALVVQNVLSRREGGALFLPLDLERDPKGERALAALSEVKELAQARAVL